MFAVDRPGIALPTLALDTRRPPTDNSRDKPLSDSEDTAHEPGAILCGFCGVPVTHERNMKSVSGAHEHHFVNPAGFFFHLGCFSRADGCEGIGELTMLDTWFEGYGWRLAVCGTCDEHLGWHFEGTSKTPFFGLVLDRLTPFTAE